ncbi:ABC transporter substrate-binding protein [Alsobacter sp. SYSU BS001988]|jgi:peptide/nickel transport system substrate-binding protein
MLRVCAVALAGVLALAGPGSAASLRIGLQSDPDLLDPARGGSFVGRVVFAALCDKLVDVSDDLKFVPQLATDWTWSPDGKALTMRLRSGVTFHDGEPFDAEAVRFNIKRYKDASYSVRKGELKPVTDVEVVDPLTVRFILSAPYAPLLSVLADRAGMMMAPKATEKAGEAASSNPSCSGPFRFKQRVAQDKIVFERFPDYWDAKSILVDEVTYLPIPDPTVNLMNLRAGQLDIIERIAATDMEAARTDARIRVSSAPSLAYYTLSINLADKSPNASPMSKDARVREAFELSFDRRVVNEVVFGGAFVPSNQTEPPGSRYFNPDAPLPQRDVEKAKKLLKEAGYDRVPFTITVANNPTDQQVAQVIQSMSAEAGFDVKIDAMEATSMVDRTNRGDYQSAVVIWSGRTDPDGNLTHWAACDGYLNWGKYCDPEVDKLLNQARTVTDEAQRVALYRQATSRWLAARAHLVLYHLNWLRAYSARVQGFHNSPDGIIRLQGVSVR